MVKMRILYLITPAVLVFAQGCAGPQEFQAKQQVCTGTLERIRAMKIAEDVLASMYFRVEKSDFDRGYIRTKPLPGGQFFEIWRADNLTPRDTAEASMHTLRKVVQLNFVQTAGRLCIDCDVRIQRLSLPEREVNSTAKAYAMFSESLSALQKVKLSAKQKKDMAWLELGDDPRLETEILNRIENGIAELRQEDEH